MKEYKTSADFWLRGVLQTAGATVWLSDAAAKYRKHFLTPVAAEAAPEPVETPVEVEAPIASKRHRKASPAPVAEPSDEEAHDNGGE